MTVQKVSWQLRTTYNKYALRHGQQYNKHVLIPMMLFNMSQQTIAICVLSWRTTIKSCNIHKMD